MLSPEGRVLGINSFVYVSDYGAEGIGFAISARTVTERVPVLRAGTAVPTATPAPRPTPTPVPGGGYDFGPMNGELRHDPSDSLVEIQYANVSVADMVVRATFINPYAASSNPWNHGFFIRDNAFRFAVTSERTWSISSYQNGAYQSLGGGTIRTISQNAGGRNHLMVVAIGTRGWFFVNEEYVGSVNLGGVTDKGDVAVTTGRWEGDEVAGAVTRYEGFKGYELVKRYGPAEGTLTGEPGRIGTHRSGVDAKNFVAEAEFSNPQERLTSFGFIARNPEFGRLEVIGVTSTAWWFHFSRNTGDDEYKELESGFLWETGLSLATGQNRLILIADDESGWFFINDNLVAKLDLGHNQHVGNIGVMGNFYSNHQGNPQFRDFIVWAP